MALYPRVESSQFALEMQGISKSFGPIKALEDVTLRVQQGTVHALVGENGAGKSTLMKILSGVHQPDTGTIVRNGKTCAWNASFRLPRSRGRDDLPRAQPRPGSHHRRERVARDRAPRPAARHLQQKSNARRHPCPGRKTWLRCGSQSESGEPSSEHLPDCRSAEGPCA